MVGTDGVNRVYVYSQAGQLMYSGVAGTAGTKHIYLRNHMVAEVAPSGTQYLHTDGLGSPVARTNAASTVLSRTRYEPYGATAAGATPSIGFTGHVNEADTGLVYMQQRYYDPIAGRFLSIDPVVTDTDTGGSFNRYAYANNSPYKYVDPDGRKSLVRLVQVLAKVLGKAEQQAAKSAAKEASNEGVNAVGKSAVQALKLEKSLASEAQTARLAAGKGEVIAGAGTKTPYRDAGRLAEQHGGKANDWQKVSGGNHVAKDGTRIETHAAQNRETKQVVEVKTKLKDEGQP